MTIPGTSLDNPDHVYLHGLALKNYRGIGEDFVFMPNFGKFNIFIGPNNAGKSTVLNFISRHLPVEGLGRTESQPPIDPLERNQLGGNIAMRLGIPLETAYQAAHSQFKRNESPYGNKDAILRKLMEQIADPYSLLWLGYAEPLKKTGPSLHVEGLSEAYYAGILPRDAWQNIWAQLTRQSSGGFMQHWVPETLRTIASLQNQQLPATFLIPAIREVKQGEYSLTQFNGSGLIEQLARLQQPALEKLADRARFEKINRFLREITGCTDAQIDVPHHLQHLLVRMEGRTLPLASLGTGIHEVIIIAAACTVIEKSIVCIEEPEIHLHPILQRKLLAYLAANTDNQYFIATHSSAFIDIPGAQVFRVQLKKNETTITPALNGSDKFEICADLGYRASDILQTNAVIWVEGPSDRLYLNNWIASYRQKQGGPAFVEGIHYSIMFYGGRLLSHLTADDESVDDFIALQRLNRNVAIVMDSDKASARERINGTKQRLIKEIGGNNGLNRRGVAWVTKGREIENYLEAAPLEAALKDRYPAIFGSRSDPGNYGHALHFQEAPTAGGRGKKAKAGNSICKEIDKVGVAHRLCREPLSLGVLDLEERIREIVELIERANK